MNPSTASTCSADRLAWQAYADACCAHDGRSGRRAVAELVATHAVASPCPSSGESAQ